MSRFAESFRLLVLLPILLAPCMAAGESGWGAGAAYEPLDEEPPAVVIPDSKRRDTGTYPVSFESEPPGAEVQLDGIDLCITPCVRGVSAGEHSVLFGRIRYAFVEESISVIGPMAVHGMLAPLFGWVSVISEPAGLVVWLDGAPLGVTPISRHEVEAGVHSIVIRDHRYYPSGDEEFTLEAAQHRMFELAPEPRKGKLRVRAVSSDRGEVLERRVTLDGVEVGTTPWEATVAVGYRRVSVGGWIRDVRVSERKAVTETFELTLPRGVPGLAGESLVNSIGMEMMRIPAGKFMMGSSATESGHEVDEKHHPVTLSHGILLAATEVTQEQWESVMGLNPSQFQGHGRPVENVNWYDAVDFCNRLSEHEGLTQAYVIQKASIRWDTSANGYRLPTEAEWEYACRAGSAAPFHFGAGITPSQVNYDGNSPYDGGVPGENRQQTVGVGSLPPNVWGLYEMHGNVWEWCWDFFAPYMAVSLPDPSGPISGTWRVMRGGGWDYPASYCRSAVRFPMSPGMRSGSVGLRVARSVP